MQRLVIFALFVVAALCLAPLHTHTDEDRIPFSYIVKLKQHVQLGAQQNIKSTLLGMHPTHKITHEYVKVLNGFSANLTTDGVNLLRSNPDVEYVQEDGWAHIGQTCSQQQNPPSWGLARVGIVGCPSGRTFFEYHTSAGAGVRAYILDTGIRITHNEFEGRAQYGANFIPGEGDPDGHGHGTHVCGTVVALTHGVAKKATCIAVKVLSAQGSGSWAGVIAGMDWTAQNGTPNKDVANMSLGGGRNQATDDAANNLVAAGITVVVAAGNNGGNACNSSPAAADDVICVGATEQTVEGTANDRKASWSNFGACVEIFAPGESILSCHHTSDQATTTMSGTSMASPHVCGVAALIQGYGAGFTPAVVLTILEDEGSHNCITGLDAASPNIVVSCGFQCL
jgi:subtilisin family serine protease